MDRGIDDPSPEPLLFSAQVAFILQDGFCAVRVGARTGQEAVYAWACKVLTAFAALTMIAGLGTSIITALPALVGPLQSKAAAKPVSQAARRLPVKVASPSFNYALYGKGVIPLVVAGSTHHRCPYQYACCIQPQAGTTTPPEHKNYYYGCYNLRNEYGTRVIYNQPGSATFSGNSYYDCSGTVQWTETPGLYFKVNITPTGAVCFAPNQCPATGGFLLSGFCQ